MLTLKIVEMDSGRDFGTNWVESKVLSESLWFRGWILFLKGLLCLRELTSDLVFNLPRYGFHPIHATKIALAKVNNKPQKSLLSSCMVFSEIIWDCWHFAPFFLKRSSLLDGVTQHGLGFSPTSQVLCVVSISRSTFSILYLQYWHLPRLWHKPLMSYPPNTVFASLALLYYLNANDF